MKKIKFLATLLAAGALVACNETIEPQGSGENAPYEGEAGYINISLNLPTTSGTNTKANDNFDDGIASEYNVNNAIIALFYGKDEASAKCKYAFKLNETDFQTTGTTTDNITSYYASGVRMIEAPGENENIYALAILNAPSDFPYSVTTTADDKEASGDAVLTTKLQKNNADFTGILTDFTTSSADYNENIASIASDGNFLMTNAPIASAATFADGSKPTDFNVTTLAPVTVYNEKSIAEGSASANPIYVERAVAKTTVKVSSADNTLTVDSEVPAYDGAEVKFEGWKLQNTNKKYYYVRNVIDWDNWTSLFNTTATSNLNRFFGNTANPYRTYWGKDPNYDLVTDNLSDNFNIISEDGNNWNSFDQNEYCAENTSNYNAMQDNNLTSVLLKAQFIPEGATPTDDFFMIRGYSAIYSEEEFLTVAMDACRDLGGNDALGNNKIVLKSDITGGKNITDNTGVQSILELSDGSELTDNQATEILKAAENVIKYYQGGVTYYYATLISHFGNTETPLANDKVISSLSDYEEASHLGRWGVLRNNWYELNITSVSGPGEPDVPEIPSEPADETNSYVNFEINVLSWAKRSQDVDL